MARASRKQHAAKPLEKMQCKPNQLAECVAEFKAFAHGGLPGLYVLSKVWRNVMKGHNIDIAYSKYVLLQAGLRLTQKEGIQLINAPAIPECDISDAFYSS